MIYFSYIFNWLSMFWCLRYIISHKHFFVFLWNYKDYTKTFLYCTAFVWPQGPEILSICSLVQDTSVKNFKKTHKNMQAHEILIMRFPNITGIADHIIIIILWQRKVTIDFVQWLVAIGQIMVQILADSPKSGPHLLLSRRTRE